MEETYRSNEKKNDIYIYNGHQNPACCERAARRGPCLCGKKKRGPTYDFDFAAFSLYIAPQGFDCSLSGPSSSFFSVWKKGRHLATATFSPDTSPGHEALG